MRKTFPLHIDGRHPDRVLEAVKHEIRKYIKRERRRELPEGADFWDFDCRVGADKEAAEVVHLAALTDSINRLAEAGSAQLYVEILARAAHRTVRNPAVPQEPTEAQPAPAPATPAD